MSDPENQNRINIVPFEDRFAPDFARLNLEWLEGFNLLEAADEKYLAAPRQKIIDKGGHIFFAVAGEAVAGTCAVMKTSQEGVVELAKLAVTHGYQGRGIGRALAVAAIEYSREIGAEKITLLSNSSLRSALGLYESLGFKHLPVPPDVEYVTTDIYMELLITRADRPGLNPDLLKAPAIF